VARCDSYDVGECTWGACHLEAWVPEHWGNANEWRGNAQNAGYGITRTPTLHAIACFGPGGPYDPVYGHLGVVVRVKDDTHFEVQEMNYSYWNRYDARWTDDYYLAAFILPPGVAPGEGGAGAPLDTSSDRDRTDTAWSRLSQLVTVDALAYLRRNYQVQYVADALRR
jgi:surface antigen